MNLESKASQSLHSDCVRSLYDYENVYPEENISNTLEFVKANKDSISRKNEVAHVTASGLVYRDGKVLVVYHKNLQKYLQPGGHLEGDFTLVEAAQREVFEETGLKVRTSALFSDKIPLSLDVHKIPANPRKSEGEHLHHDCMFLFETTSDQITIDENEVEGYKWISIDEDFGDNALGKAVVKLRELLS
jgi:8-oxo-dGTP pyrophosphatase MutT (NUDIX family)